VFDRQAAVEKGIETMPAGYSQATQLKQNADRISETFSKCEKTCLQVGARLGDAIPNLSDLGELFKTLSQSLESEGFRAANSDLRAVALDISAIGAELTTESKGLDHLVALNKAIAIRIENLSSNIRTIAALVFNVKIEAASFAGTADNMSDFVDGLQFLATKAQSAVGRYQSTHIKLYELLQNTSKAQLGFQNSHQERLLSVAADITDSLEVIERRRREMTAALADIGTQSQQIGMHIGQGVVALQIGDSTRQRIEHAHAALHLAAGLLDGAEPSTSLVAAGICQLQSLQINAALSDFTKEMSTIEALLRGLASDSGTLASRGRALFGAGDTGADSFLEELERKLKAVNALVEESRHARAIVDQATSAVGVTMTDMETQTASLSEIVVDMTMLGMNAVLKSTRLGQRGLGLNVIAQELRSYAVEIVRGIKTLKPAIDEVMTFVGEISKAGESRNAGHMMKLGGRMTAAIGIFKSSGTQMSEALMRLQRESDCVGQVIDEAARQLGGDNDISETLLEVVTSINYLAVQIADPNEIGGQSAAEIDRLLRASYTMACERDIHEAFLSRSGCETSSGFSPSRRDDTENVEAFLF
jgi:hypothetical protein